MSEPDVNDEWVQRVQDAVEDLLVELEQNIRHVLDYTLNNIEEELTASELDIQQIFKEKQKELFGQEFQEKEREDD